jgi:LPXTG-motif cell wall-anchored protein
VGLAPGKYVFRLADPEGARNVVQVVSADGKRAYGMFFTMAVERDRPADQPEVRFMETAAGTPPAIRTMWYPGLRTGLEFIYPKEQARRLAQSAREPVLTTQSQTTTTDQTNTAGVSRISSNGQETRVAGGSNPSTSSAPSGVAQRGDLAPASIAIPAAPVALVAKADTRSNAPGSRPARTRLPQTGSTAPLVGLSGLCFLVAALALRYRRTARV